MGAYLPRKWPVLSQWPDKIRCDCCYSERRWAEADGHPFPPELLRQLAFLSLDPKAGSMLTAEVHQHVCQAPSVCSAVGSILSDADACTCVACTAGSTENLAISLRIRVLYCSVVSICRRCCICTWWAQIRGDVARRWAGSGLGHPTTVDSEAAWTLLAHSDTMHASRQAAAVKSAHLLDGGAVFERVWHSHGRALLCQPVSLQHLLVLSFGSKPPNKSYK